MVVIVTFWCAAITWTNADLLWTGHSETCFNEIQSKFKYFLWKKMRIWNSFSFKENKFEIAVCKMLAILFRPQCVKALRLESSVSVKGDSISRSFLTWGSSMRRGLSWDLLLMGNIMKSTGNASISQITYIRSRKVKQQHFFSMVWSLRNLTGISAAMLLSHLSNFKAHWLSKLPILPFWDFTRFYNKMSLWILK